MSITKKPKDSYETIINDTMPYNIFLYWLSDDLLKNKQENSIPMTHSNSILSIQYAPYLNTNELDLNEIEYDIERFKFKDNGMQVPIPNGKKPKVYRITQFQNQNPTSLGTLNKRIGRFKCYEPNLTNIKKRRDWRNESKLYNYPYRQAYITDGIIQPIEFKYHLCQNNDTEVWVRSCMNINADYSIYLRNYSNDYDGLLEQFVCTQNKELPSTSNQYAQWLATNKNQMVAQNSNLVSNTITGMIGAGIMTGGNPWGALAGGVVSLAGGLMGNNIKQNATEKDMRNVPNVLLSKGGDFFLGMNTHKKRTLLVRYRQRDEIMQKIGDYFAMYGYKQNKIMSINKRNRYFYNYIKTQEVNINGNGIPKEHFEELKQIYDNGVTIWHMDRKGVEMCNYYYDNYEV